MPTFKLTHLPASAEEIRDEVALRRADPDWPPADRDELRNKLSQLAPVLNAAQIHRDTGLSPATVMNMVRGNPAEPMRRLHATKLETLTVWLQLNYEELLVKMTERDDELVAKAFRLVERKQRLERREQMRLEHVLAKSSGRYWQAGKYNLRKWGDADLIGLSKEIVIEGRRRKAAAADLVASESEAGVNNGNGTK